MTTTLKGAFTGAALAVLAAFQPAAAQAPITLQWQTANLTERQFEPVWRQMIQEFEAANPGIKIEPVPVARRDHWTKFVTAAQARLAPCLVSVDLTTAAYNGYLMPLDRFWNAEPAAFRAAWSEDVMRSARWRGQLYGLPIWGGIYAEVYNRDHVVEAGLDPNKPPATFAEYLEWMTKLTRADRHGLAILGGRTDTTTRVLLSWIYANGGEPFNADMTQATFAANAKSLEAIRFYVDLLARHNVAAPGATTTNYLEQTTLFAQGRISSMRNAFWGMAKVEGDNPAMRGRMMVGPIPATIPNAPTLSTVTSTSISANCQHPEAAWRFIRFEAEPKWSIMRAEVANWMPLRTDLLNEPAIRNNPMLTRFLEIGRISRPYPLPHPIWADIAAGDIVDAFQKALLNPAQTEQIFRDLDRALTRKLNDI